MTEQRTLDSIKVDHPAPTHVATDRVVDLSWTLGFSPNNLVDPYEPCGWLSGNEIPNLLHSAVLPNAMGGSRGAWIVIPTALNVDL